MFTPCRAAAVRLARWVLAAFALAIGLAAVSPLLHTPAWAQALGHELSAVPADLGRADCHAEAAAPAMAAAGHPGHGDAAEPAGDAPSPHGGHALDCAFCLPGGAPPSFAWAVLPVAQPLAPALRPLEAARITALTGAPLPARGPPPG